MKLHLRLIPGWRRCYRLTSVQASTGLMLFSMLQADVLPMLSGKLQPNPLWWVTFLIGAGIVILRVLSQPGVLDDPKPKAPTQ